MVQTQQLTSTSQHRLPRAQSPSTLPTGSMTEVGGVSIKLDRSITAVPTSHKYDPRFTRIPSGRTLSVACTPTPPYGAVSIPHHHHHHHCTPDIQPNHQHSNTLTGKTLTHRPAFERRPISHARCSARPESTLRYEMTLHGTILGISSIATPLRLRPPSERSHHTLSYLN
ncbi:MAG: hypothetical protein L6R40_006747 [Gallowayella cf. fulva]|nr:MAG: hypothetical protein L6R40_006747 [Xanthomendoza cf. fulva]